MTCAEGLHESPNQRSLAVGGLGPHQEFGGDDRTNDQARERGVVESLKLRANAASRNARI